MGRKGLVNVARLSYKRAHLLHNKLKSMGFKSLNEHPFYDEFIMKAPPGLLEPISANLDKNRILGGLKLEEDKILICCTEMNTVEDIELFSSIVKETITK
jgi:glycine dehydrogenase subunit 1